VKCDQHHEKEAVAVCVSCGTGVCEDCRLLLAGKNYCQHCADNLAKERNSVNNQSLPYPVVESYEGLDAGEFIFICIFSPIAGAIAYLAWHDNKPKKAQQSGIIAVAVFAVLLFIYIMYIQSLSYYYY
jgi:hypothetical protein